MQFCDGHFILSATDLSNFLACPQLTLLGRRAAQGGPQPPRYDDPGIEALRQRGFEHEERLLAQYRAAGKQIAIIAEPGPELTGVEKWRTLASLTLDEMRRGVDVVYQGTLYDHPWGGRTDFLVRVDAPSPAFGAWSYEVVDAKLARAAKAGALLQVLHYADLLAKVQGCSPEFVHLALGGPEAHTEPFRVTDYAAYYRMLRNRFVEFMGHAREPEIAPDPVPHCDICAWRSTCDRQRHDVDHLSLVAGITKRQRAALVAHGTTTLQALAELKLPLEPALDDINAASLERIQHQAFVQLKGRREQRPYYELLPVVEEQGLAALPEPSPGDLFFDLEGDPFAHVYGIEYLFGYADANGNYFAKWALDPDEEKRVFEEFIDFVMARLEQYPDMHIYHYAPYETTALKRLMGRYGTREDAVDRLLRGRVLVDLYRVVKQGMRASVESYSIKKLEEFYGYERDVDLAVANRALATFAASLEMGTGIDRSWLPEIEGYNRDDVISTLRLRAWLESLRTADMPRPAATDPEPSDELREVQQEIASVFAALTEGISADPDARTPSQQARWLLAQLLEFHRREKKQFWWEYFRLRDMPDEDRFDERKTITGLELVDSWKDPKPKTRSWIYRYRFPLQEHSFDLGDKTRAAVTEENTGEVVGIDDVNCTIDLRRTPNGAAHPRSIILYDDVQDKVLRSSLLAFGRDLATSAESREYACARDLLFNRGINSSIKAIQGPPGAGKTHTGAHLILEALAAGKKVGVTANSHKVIGNLLRKVCSEAARKGVGVTGIQRADEEDWCACPEIACGKNDVVLAALSSGTHKLAAGTAWLWSRPDMMQSVDVLFIDEAGQFSLANALAVAPAAKELVLLGDPQQLDQPLQGVHPPGVAVSALGHVLGDHATMPADRGVFLDKTWRLHPSITEFTSEIFYENKLASRDGLEVQNVAGQSGVLLYPVPHAGNTNESLEEVAAVARIVEEMVQAKLTWTNEKGESKPLTEDDIVIVAPYNMQVSEIARRLPHARVGTVDKFQGQEAAVAIYSTATSTAADAPRGMKFLYSPNRFNVATSRARCLAVVVASPDLFTPECRTPEQMRWANAFCRFAELAARTTSTPECRTGAGVECANGSRATITMGVCP